MRPTPTPSTKKARLQAEFLRLAEEAGPLPSSVMARGHALSGAPAGRDVEVVARLLVGGLPGADPNASEERVTRLVAKLARLVEADRAAAVPSAKRVR